MAVRRSLKPMSSPSFAELGVSNAVVDALTEQGITAPFPVQRLVLEDLIAGHDVMVKSPTARARPSPSACR
jgi:superfamily II DNA/RNA helicase